MTNPGNVSLAQRLRRRWQVHPGAPNLLSTARSFSPPVGSRIGEAGTDGYYIDFTRKADATDWPPYWLPPPERQIHVGTAQFGLGCIERYLAGDGDIWLETAIVAARHLLEIQAPDGAWPHRTALHHSYHLPAPWLSAMAQGEGASLFVRLHRHTGEDRYADAALAALGPMRVPSSEGGVRAELAGGFFPEEYPSEPPSFVLNGAIFALWGCRDVALALEDGGAATLYEEGLQTLARSLHRYDTGRWSLYDLFPHPIPNVASGAYHQLHIAQLEAMQLVSPRPEFARIHERFVAYQASRAARARATGEKVALRLLVPRNERLAFRLPWSQRPDLGEVLVLCYHAVSEDWPAALATTPAGLREHLGSLVAAGYEGATFTEAVTTRTAAKRLVITFDDAFESVESEGFPILAELGLPGTLFVPTSFPGSGRELAWPGIDQWRETPHRGELEPLDWAAIERLRLAGWEIGSHSVSHPRLTRLTDAELEQELALSRAELERRTGVRCRSIAYPYGDVDRRVVEAARNAGYVTGAALPAELYFPHRLSWPRIGIYRRDRGWRFEAKVSGVSRRLRTSPAWSLARRARSTGSRARA